MGITSKRLLSAALLAVTSVAVAPAASLEAATLVPSDAPSLCSNLRLQVSESGVEALPFANPECPGARPGAGYLVTLASGRYRCSLAFMFQGSDGKRYFSTAGHCLLDDGDPEEVTWASGAGALVTDMQGRPFGRGVYARLDNKFDIGIIEIDESSTSPISPQVCHFGGPTAFRSVSALDAPDAVHHYGYGQNYKDILRARTGLVADHLTANYLRMESNVAGGDSGSSLIDNEGRAIGIVVRGLMVGAAYAEASRLDVHLPLAEEALGIDLELVTAPLLSR